MTPRSPGAKVGAFVLRERLAVGGMSEVFLADAPAGETVVVKLLSDRHRRDPVYRELLIHEAALGRSLAHPNVVAVLDAGEQQGEPYLVLEYVEGVDLWRLQRALQHTMRRMEAPLACHVVREILAGIAHIHGLRGPDGHGLIHRDVSPSNVFLSMTGDVRLGDLGIAVSARPPSPTVQSASGPRPAPVMPPVNRGKVGYMAAEQLLGQAVDHRVDLFAAGVVLAEVLTGRSLFTSGSDVGTMIKDRDAQVEALIEVLGDHPASLVSVVLRALARSPAERFQSAEEFRAALGPHAGDAAEARPLLAALVGWARTAGRAIARGSNPDETPTPEQPRARAMRPSEVAALYQRPPDPEVTREVPLVFYDVSAASGTARGRFTWARLLEMAFDGTLTADDLITGPDEKTRRAIDVREIAPHLADRTATTSEVAGAVADWADALPACSFVHALSRLVFAEESGMLVAEAAPTRREVYVFKGRPTHLASNLASDMVGEYLVSQGAIKRGELDMALAVMPRFDGRLPRAIVQLGLMDENRLAQMCDTLSRDRLMDLFRWRRGTLRYYRGVTPPPTSLALTVDPHEVLRNGVQAMGDFTDHFEPLRERKVGVAAALRGLQRVGLGPLGHELLARADGRTTVTQLVQRIAADRKAPTPDVYRELYLLVEIGALELR